MTSRPGCHPYPTSRAHIIRYRRNLNSRGGVERYLAETSAGLSSLGWESTIISRLAPEHFQVPRGARFITAHEFRTPVGALSPRLLSEVVARRPAVVELFGLNSYSAMLSTVGPWVRIVYPFFHPEILGTPREDALRARVRRAISWASALVLMTEDERDSLERVAGKPLKKYFVVPPGSSYGGQHEIERSRHTILVVSRLEPSKAVDVVIRAALTAGKLEHLRVIGDGPERPILEELIRSSGIEPGSVLLGSLDDERLYSAFRSARLLVSMSRSESYGITLAEGLSAGLPIVASSIQTHRAILAAIPPTFHRIIKVDDEASLARVLLEPPPIPETTLHSRPWSAVANDLDQMYASLAGKR